MSRAESASRRSAARASARASAEKSFLDRVRRFPAPRSPWCALRRRQSPARVHAKAQSSTRTTAAPYRARATPHRTFRVRSPMVQLTPRRDFRGAYARNAIASVVSRRRMTMNYLSSSSSSSAHTSAYRTRRAFLSRGAARRALSTEPRATRRVISTSGDLTKQISICHICTNSTHYAVLSTHVAHRGSKPRGATPVPNAPKVD